MIHLKNVTFTLENSPARDVYPFNLPVFHETQKLVFSSPVTFFSGENGTGKSTLLAALAEKCRIHIWEGLEKTRFKRNPLKKCFTSSSVCSGQTVRCPDRTLTLKSQKTLPPTWTSGRPPTPVSWIILAGSLL